NSPGGIATIDDGSTYGSTFIYECAGGHIGMNLELFRAHLADRDEKLSVLYREISESIKRGSFTDAHALWSDKDLVNCRPIEERAARVIFPHQVHLLYTSIFYDRVYFLLEDIHLSGPHFSLIENETWFRKQYQIAPSDMLALIQANRIVPILAPIRGDI